MRGNRECTIKAIIYSISMSTLWIFSFVLSLFFKLHAAKVSLWSLWDQMVLSTL